MVFQVPDDFVFIVRHLFVFKEIWIDFEDRAAGGETQ